MNNFVQRIYKLYIDLGTIKEVQVDKHCKRVLKKFKVGLDETKQKVFLIANRNEINELRIITTYYDEKNNMYYTIES